MLWLGVGVGVGITRLALLSLMTRTQNSHTRSKEKNFQSDLNNISRKGKRKGHPRTSHEGPEGGVKA
jgi:hypothetical protein